MVVSNLGVLLSSSFILFKYYLQVVMNMAKLIKLEENKVVIAKDDDTILSKTSEIVEIFIKIYNVKEIYHERSKSCCNP